MALCVLISVGLAADSLPDRDAAMSMAHALDGRLLGPMADASAFTGIMLAAATPWGFFRNWWVLVKFAITMIQLYLGIFLLSPKLTDSLAAGPSRVQIIGTALMAGAIAFQGWVSVAKPWGKVRRRRGPPPGTGPRWIFAITVSGALADLALAITIGHPMPLLSLTLLAVGLASRPRWITDGTTRRSIP